MKKNRTSLYRESFIPIRKYLRIMKLTFTLLLLGLMSHASVTYSQATKLSFESENATIESVFKQIESLSEFKFAYNSTKLDVDKKISLKVENQTINAILDKILGSTNFQYQIIDRYIIITDENGEKLNSSSIEQSTKKITGKVTDTSGNPLPGVSVVVKGTTNGSITDSNGLYSLSNIPENAVLQFSFVGMKRQEVKVGSESTINVQLSEETIGVDEVVVIGYGTQKKSDITGTVASLPKERLEMAANLNIAQAIQGAIPGVMIQTSLAGAAPSEAIMIRGRNSITASNDPLIVVDGIPYGGLISDINPNDVKSIEILKDASAAAIYGSRGSNGVILITSKEGSSGKPVVSYDGKVSLQRYTKLPDMMNGKEFYKFKMERVPGMMTASEQAVYDSGKWIDWMDLVTRNGNSQEHNLSISGGFQKTTYYIAGSLLDVKGIQVNDNFKRITSRINIDTKINDWLTLGSRTQMSYTDMSGKSPDSAPTRMNPLTTAFDENGKPTIYPWPEDIYWANPLECTLWKDIDKSYQIIANNYAIIDFPFVKGLSYRLNSGIRLKFHDEATYKSRDGKEGVEKRGESITNRTLWNNAVIENILSYNKEFGKHTVFATALYSFENNKTTGNGETAKGFPHDFLAWYSAAQAETSVPHYSFDETVLISQMVRLNYTYDSRYLLTLTGRRDGYSGFGAKSKWGIFPSVALGWNLSKEEFFPLKGLFNELKLRASLGLNGNQAVGAYETITRLGSADWLSSQTVMPGYIPSTIGMDDLGWESSKTLNLGLDFGILQNRITGDFNVYKTNTTDLLLDRTISAVHGITSVTQNIGETENEGIELTINSKNIVTPSFTWSISGNMAIVKNKILSLYGLLDKDGNEIDDIGNKWFIGHPIRVNYNYTIAGVWQLDEAEEAASWGSKPGFVKFKDVNDDHLLTAADREFHGQQDPKLLWGMTNTFSYKNFKLDIFLHGVHGVTKQNEYMMDDVYDGVRRNTINKNWWTPDNPTNDFYMNSVNAHLMAGVSAQDPERTDDGKYFENAGFVRIKEVTLSYNFSKNLESKVGLDKLQLFVTGRNLFTFTQWTGMDPELDDQRNIPLQKEFVFGLNVSF